MEEEQERMGGRSDELQEGKRGRLGEGRTRVIQLYKGGCKGIEQWYALVVTYSIDTYVYTEAQHTETL